MREEMATTVGDVLDRRTRASLRDARATAAAAARVADLIGSRARLGPGPRRSRGGRLRRARSSPCWPGPASTPGPSPVPRRRHLSARRQPRRQRSAGDHSDCGDVDRRPSRRRLRSSRGPPDRGEPGAAPVAWPTPAPRSATTEADRAEAGRDWWPLAIGWAADGEVPARPAVVARPERHRPGGRGPGRSATEAGVPVTAAGGRSGVCGASIPSFGGVALDLCGLAGITEVDPVSLIADVRAGTFGPDVESALRSARPDPRSLAPVDGPLHGRGLAGLPRRRPVLEPLREDRGHGHRARGGAGRRAGDPDRRPGAPFGHRARPDPALRGQRGHARGHHRGPVPGPPGPRRRGPAGVRLRHLRRRAGGLPADPAPGRDPGGAAPLRRDRVGAVVRRSGTPAC